MEEIMLSKVWEHGTVAVNFVFPVLLVALMC
jgi:hypothetical protein